jgi:hypothetical protein
VAVVGSKAGGDRGLAMFQWGFIPHWAADAKGPKPVNAKAETLAEKPAFRDSFRERRCLIPADGFTAASHTIGQEAAFLPFEERRTYGTRRHLGCLAKSDQQSLHLRHHHHGAQCGDRADSQPNAGDPRAFGLGSLA